jgi:hypothetical protein
MSEVAAVAPAAPAPAQANGAPAGVVEAPAPQAPKAAPQPNGGRARANDGRFLPRDGAVGVAGEPADGPPAEPPKESLRVRGRAKVYGKEEEYDYDEDGVRRLHQKARAYEAKQREHLEQSTRAQRILELAEADPDAFLRAIQKDPTEWARQRMAQEAQLAAMSEHERRAYDFEQENAHLKAELEKRLAAEKAQQRDANQQQLRERLEAQFIPALEKSGLPKTHESLFLMAETWKLAKDNGIELSPDEIASETEHRLSTFTERFLGSLDGPGLVKRLGPKRIQAILAATIAEHEKTLGMEPPRQAVQAAVEAPAEPIDEREVNRRMRALRMGM